MNEQHEDVLAAGDVPRLRRDLADWYGGPTGVQFFAEAIRWGKQTVRPAGPAAVVARQLAADEAARLSEADLWYLDDDLCALLGDAYPSMPAFAPAPHDLPSRCGFAMFESPIAVYPGSQANIAGAVDAMVRDGGGDAVRAAAERARHETVRIIAVSWAPYRNPGWAAGGLWMSFYSRSTLLATDFEGTVDEATVRRARSFLPPLTIDNECALAWRPEGAPPDRYLLHGGEGQTGTASWARLVLAAFRLAGQRNLAEQETLRTPRPERRRAEKAGLAPRDVRVVRLRGSVAGQRAGEQAGGGREWRHRWVVRGHWREAWYPSLQDHRPRWIAPYLKGPDGAPLLGGDRVNVLGAPDAPLGPDGAR